MPVPLIAAGIGAVASIGGGLLANSASKKATKAATQAATETTDKNNALQREVYQQNTANLSPFLQRGNQAGNALQGLLFGPQAAPQQQTGQYGAPQPVNALSGYSPVNGMPPDYYPWDDANMYGVTAEDAWAQQQMPPGMPQPGQVPQGTVNALAPVANPMDGFRQYIDNSDYAFRFEQGNKGLNQGLAARGMGQSGAAMKALEQYRQHLNAGYRGEYMNLLGQQQNVGLSGANALAGVGTNMANAIGAQNNAGASVVANAALMNGAAQGQFYSGIGNALGNFAGQFGSSYKKPYNVIGM